MAVTAPKNDPAGLALDSAITSINTLITAAVAGSAQATQLTFALYAAQSAAVQHYLATGRLQPALVLAAAL